jgi:hypothetical protein
VAWLEATFSNCRDYQKASIRQIEASSVARCREER